MPTVRRTRTVAATADEVWRVVGDPHHLPRWWPRVVRVEAVEDGEFTEVLRSDKGKTVRADFRVAEQRPEEGVVWSQQIEGTPFARVLRSAETEIALTPVGPAATEVAIELRQALPGMFANRTFAVSWFGGRLVRRAALRTADEALDGLERVFGGVHGGSTGALGRVDDG